MPDKNRNYGEIRAAENVNPVVNAINQYFRELKYRLNNNKVVTGKYTIPAALLAATGIAPFVTSKAAATTATAGLIGGTAAGIAIDQISEKLTGKNWGENVSKLTGLDIEPASITNPGYLYGAKVGNNYSKLGRYTLNNLNPRSYNFDAKHVKQLFNVYTEPLYNSPPKFFNDKKPKWYVGGIPDDTRFQNGAIWARIPEEEIPRSLFVKNADGVTYRPTEKAIKGNIYGNRGADLLELNNPEVIETAIANQMKGKPGLVDLDAFATTGGLHSDYYYLGSDGKNAIWGFYDPQKLNFQWKYTDPIKNLSKNKNSLWYRFFHKLGGIDLSRLLGYKGFEHKFGIKVPFNNPNNATYFDITTNKVVPK